MALTDLGFTNLQEHVYRALLAEPDRNPPRLRRPIDTDADVASAISGLVERGVLRPDASRAAGVVVVDPAAAVGELIERAEDALLLRQRRLGALRTEVAELSAGYARHPADPDGADAVERVASLEQVREKLKELSFFTTTTLRSVQPGGPQSAAALDACRPLDLRGLRRGVDMRIIYQAQVLDHAANRAYLAEISAAGANVRVADEPLDRLLVMDERITVVPIDPTDSRRGALVARQPGLVRAMTRLFDRLWADAEPIDGVPCGGEPELDAVDHRVLTVLADGGTDEAVSRATGFSVRQIRRRVARLMDMLDATSRFEAGVHAARRGWI